MNASSSGSRGIRTRTPAAASPATTPRRAPRRAPSSSQPAASLVGEHRAGASAHLVAERGDRLAELRGARGRPPRRCVTRRRRLARSCDRVVAAGPSGPAPRPRASTRSPPARVRAPRPAARSRSTGRSTSVRRPPRRSGSAAAVSGSSARCVGELAPELLAPGPPRPAPAPQARAGASGAGRAPPDRRPPRAT